jgi:hypothetical protein
MKLQSLHNELQDRFYELRAECASRQTFRYLPPVYHRSVCPELRVPAETCQSLPGLRMDCLRRTGKKNARHTVRLSLRAEALTVDGRYTTMTATRAHLSPWPPLRLSMKLQQSLHNEVQDWFHELRAERASRQTFRHLHPVYHRSVCPKLRVPAETCQSLPGTLARPLLPGPARPGQVGGFWQFVVWYWQSVSGSMGTEP